MPPFIENAIPDEDSFSELQPQFVEVGAPMEEMWRLVMPHLFCGRGFGGTEEIMVGLKKILRCFPEDFKQNDRSWALDALDKGLIFQQKRRFNVVLNSALPYRRHRGMLSVGGPSAGGIMSGSNMFGGPTAGLLSESLPPRLPWAASVSPPLVPSAEVHTQPHRPLATRSCPPSGRSEHAGSDTGH